MIFLKLTIIMTQLLLSMMSGVNKTCMHLSFNLHVYLVWYICTVSIAIINMKQLKLRKLKHLTPDHRVEK